jgi:hypothetical protein
VVQVRVQVEAPSRQTWTLSSTIPLGPTNLGLSGTPTRVAPTPMAISKAPAILDSNLASSCQCQCSHPSEAPDGPNPSARRPLSRTDTDILHEDSQDQIVLEIQQRGIKVRDYAYESSLKIPELFDSDKALREHDHRLTQRPRTIPIAGKMLRRLLDMRWVTMQEAKERWDKMDWDELALHDSRPVYPWKALRLHFPSTDERENIRRQCAVELDDAARQQRQWQAYEERRQNEREQVLKDILQCSLAAAEAALGTLPANHSGVNAAATGDSKSRLDIDNELNSLPTTKRRKLQAFGLIAPEQQFPEGCIHR